MIAPSGSKPLQSYTAYRIHYYSGRKLVAVMQFVGLTFLLDRIVAFTIAFGIEALLFSAGLLARFPVGVALTIMVLLVFWCTLFILAASTDLGVLARIHVLKGSLASFTRGLRGRVSEHAPLQ